MTAESIDTFVLAFRDPTPSQTFKNRPAENYNNSNLSFELFIQDNLRTLSTNSASSAGSVGGLLYVPTLDPSDPCTNISAKYVPRNVTRLPDLPMGRYPYIALVPWLPICTKSFLAAAQGGSGMIVYLPEDRNGTPPAVNDPAWKLDDGGSWKSGNKYPVYAVPGSAGTIIMHQLSLYSGNATNVTNGDILAADHNSGQYIRLYTSITLSSQSSLPSLWAFLLIVLGIVLFLIGATSVSMHCIQRRNRQNLRRRVADGEVDLEALGIKRLTVPREALDRMPLFIYSASEDQQTDKYSTKSASRTEAVLPEGHFSPDIPSKPLSTCKPSYMTTQPSSKAAKTEPKSEASSFPLSLPHHQLSFSQPTCPICLDDFESHHTAVRELPCQHVFHPGCIDVFLTENSSLCPVCKAKVLPKGYCPEIITNAMVRRERQTRRRQQQRNLAAMPARRTSQGVHNREMSVGRRITSLHGHFGRTGTSETDDRRFSSAPNRLDATELDLGNRSSTNPSANTQIITRPAVDRREWVRRRASALLRHQRTADDEDREGWATLPRWRKAIRSVFPGYH